MDRTLRSSLLDDAPTSRVNNDSAPGRRTLTGSIMRRAQGAPAPDAQDAVSEASASSGAPLPAELRSPFEQSLGADLGGVRVHTGAASADAASSVGARAYTIGQDVHFAAGQYDPGSDTGRHLIAHEVAHTVQQSGGAPHPQMKLEVSTPGDAHEVEADAAADRMVSGQRASVSSAGASIARDPLDETKKPELDPSRFVYCDGADWKSLRAELANSDKLVRAFTDADGQAYAMSAIYGVDLDNPTAAAEKLKKSMPAISDASKEKITGDRNIASTARAAMHGAQAQMQSAGGRLRLALHKQSSTPDPKAPVKIPAEDKTGDTIEKIWDATQILLTGGIELSLGSIVIGVAGMDLIKDNIKDLFNNDSERLAAMEQQLVDNTTQINSLCMSLQSAAAMEAKQAAGDLQAATAVHKEAMKNYRECLAKWSTDLAAIMEKSKAPAKPPGTKPDPLTPSDDPAVGVQALYRAILKAGELYTSANIALAGQELSQAQLPYWIKILCPIGTTVLDHPDTGKPGSVAGDMFVFEKNGKQYIFRETFETVFATSLGVDQASRVYENGPKVEKRAAAWQAAMQSVLGVS